MSEENNFHQSDFVLDQEQVQMPPSLIKTKVVGSKMGVKGKVLIAALALFMLMMISLVVVKIMSSNKTGGEVAASPTPSNIVENKSVLDKELEALDEELKVINPVNYGLNPPPVDMNIVFDKQAN